jgi:hypothetical protein
MILGLALSEGACNANEQRNINNNTKLDLGEACLEDAQCVSNFCDNLQCAMPEGVYGRPCVPAPTTADGLRDGKLHTCGAYLCLEDRCRSCVSDDQCQQELGAPRCYISEGRPGARCGDPPN